jgi:hypothetical protein
MAWIRRVFAKNRPLNRGGHSEFRLEAAGEWTATFCRVNAELQAANFRVGLRLETRQQFRRRDRGGAEFADDDAAGVVGDLGGFGGWRRRRARG